MEYHLVYQLFPRSFGINDEIKSVIECFEKITKYKNLLIITLVVMEF